MNTTKILEQLHGLDASLSRIEDGVRSLNQRLTRLEHGQVLLNQDIAQLSAARAQRQPLLAKLNNRLERIELCLEQP